MDVRMKRKVREGYHNNSFQEALQSLKVDFDLKSLKIHLCDTDQVFLTMEGNETTYRDDAYFFYKFTYSNFMQVPLSFSRAFPFISRTLINAESLVLTHLTLFM